MATSLFVQRLRRGIVYGLGADLQVSLRAPPPVVEEAEAEAYAEGVREGTTYCYMRVMSTFLHTYASIRCWEYVPPSSMSLSPSLSAATMESTCELRVMSTGDTEGGAEGAQRGEERGETDMSREGGKKGLVLLERPHNHTCNATHSSHSTVTVHSSQFTCTVIHRHLPGIVLSSHGVHSVDTVSVGCTISVKAEAFKERV